LIDHLLLAELLAAFARASVGAFAGDAILTLLCERAPRVLGVGGVGVMLHAGDDLELSRASDGRSAEVALLQRRHGEGPCHDAFTRGELVAEADPGWEVRWPRFGPDASRLGITSVYALPLSNAGERFGTLECYVADGPPLESPQLDAARLIADTAAAYLVNARAVEDLRRSEAELRHEVLHDPLTGLPNRTLLLDRIALALAKAQRHPWSPAVLFCDLDGFKAVNDGHGHLVGDNLLVAVAERLRGLVRPGDTLARLSGDEFVVVCEDVDGPEEAAVVADRIVSALREPFVLGADVLRLSVSIGIATAADAPGEPSGAIDLLRRADVTMYRAKARGGSQAMRADEEGTAAS
jgi:diguanylate cyclase (GGDEF)-like protein